MDLDYFLSEYVKGYLFDDLASMAEISPQPGMTTGAVGYPMVMTTLAGIELLGWLTNTEAFTPHSKGSVGFRWYWNQFLTPIDSRYEGLAELIYQLVRNGIGHVYIAKPGIFITKGNAETHLIVDKDKRTLVLDCLELHNHFVESYRRFVEPIVAGVEHDFASSKGNRKRSVAITRVSMELRLKDMVEVFTHNATTQFDIYSKSKRPITQPVQSISFSGAHAASGNFPQDGGKPIWYRKRLSNEPSSPPSFDDENWDTSTKEG